MTVDRIDVGMVRGEVNAVQEGGMYGRTRRTRQRPGVGGAHAERAIFLAINRDQQRCTEHIAMTEWSKEATATYPLSYPHT